MSFGDREVVVKLRDHAVTRELLSRLPMTLEFQDYMDKEKISYLPNKLASDGASPTSRGDFAYYAPWGNLAIFYNGDGRADGGLIILGRMESGKEHLAAMTVNFIARLERID